MSRAPGLRQRAIPNAPLTQEFLTTADGCDAFLVLDKGQVHHVLKRRRGGRLVGATVGGKPRAVEDASHLADAPNEAPT